MLIPVGERVGPFRIVGLLGEGGMGQVFLAHDPRLDRHVALKCVLLTHADPDSTRLILREARASARISHPNIAAVYDVIEHAGRMFIVMEHVPGESVAQRLTRGRVPPVEALAIGRQLASGLEAAHAQGVIHGDLKPANVQLTASGQVKILDFGIARAVGLTETTINGAATTRRSLVRHGAGTPAYMSPEQLVGWTIDARSDIYSAGIVLFELTMGRRPYAGEDPLELATRIATTDVPDLSAMDTAVPRMLSDVIRKALAPVPASRFQSAHDFGVALARAAAEPEQALAAPAASKRFDVRSLVVWALALGLIALVSFLALRWMRGEDPAREPLPSAVPPVVAVLGVASEAPAAYEWVGRALAEMLATELTIDPGIRLIPAEHLAPMNVELPRPNAPGYSIGTLARLRGALAADYVVSGSAVVSGTATDAAIRFDVRAQDTLAGRSVAVSESGSVSDLFDLTARAGRRVRAAVGATRQAAADIANSGLPRSADALRWYSEGVANLRVYDAQAARMLLQRAAAAESDSPLVHAALAEALAALGYDTRAASEARAAAELGQHLPRESRLLIEARYHEAVHDWAKALAAYDTLCGEHPDDVEYGLKRVNAQIAAGHTADAFNTLGALRARNPPSALRARVDLAHAEAAQRTSNWTLEEQMAESAIAEANGLGMPFVAARAYSALGWAKWKRGDLARALDAFRQAEAQYRGAGDLRGVAEALKNTANVISDQGDVAGATRLYERALALDREVGQRRETADVLNDLALIAYGAGRIGDARKLDEEAIAVYREIDDHAGLARTLSNLGSLLDDQLELRAATIAYEESLALKRAIGDRAGIAHTLTNLAILLREQGHVADAEQDARESLRLARDAGDVRAEAEALDALGEILVVQDRPVDARQNLEVARNMYGRLGGLDVSTVDVDMARLAMAEGRYDEAERLARDASSAFGALPLRISEASALNVGGRAALIAGHLDRARAQLRRARQSAGANRRVQLQLDVLDARIRATSGRAGDAVRQLEDAVRRASSSQLREIELDARLALIDARDRMPAHDDRQVALHSVVRDARATGLMLFAREADVRLRQ